MTTPLGRTTYVYIDGFNLYFGKLKRTAHKWLNIVEASRLLLPTNNVVKVKYFTARITGRPNDPDAPLRQQVYLRALMTLPEVEIIYGHFLTHPKMMPVVTPPPSYIQVHNTSEKGSDVNLASHLLLDAFDNRFEVAVVMSNDSDLLFPIQQTRTRFGKTVGMINPQVRASAALRRGSSFCKEIRQHILVRAQFPQTLTDAQGHFQKPAIW